MGRKENIEKGKRFARNWNASKESIGGLGSAAGSAVSKSADNRALRNAARIVGNNANVGLNAIRNSSKKIENANPYNMTRKAVKDAGTYAPNKFGIAVRNEASRRNANAANARDRINFANTLKQDMADERRSQKKKR